MIILKEHNVKPYAQLCEMLAIHQKCAYIAATGTGKSYVVGKYIEDHDLVDKTLVLVPSNAIKDAWEKLLPGITVMTYQTLCKDDKSISSFIFIIRLSAKVTDGVMKPVSGFHFLKFPDIVSLVRLTHYRTRGGEWRGCIAATPHFYMLSVIR